MALGNRFSFSGKWKQIAQKTASAGVSPGATNRIKSVAFSILWDSGKSFLPLEYTFDKPCSLDKLYVGISRQLCILS